MWGVLLNTSDMNPLNPLEVLCFSYACSYAGRVFPLMAGVLGNAEAQK